MALERVHQVRLDARLRVHAQVLQHLLRVLHRIPRHQLAHRLAVALVLSPPAQVPLRELLLAHVRRQAHRLARRRHLRLAHHQLLHLLLLRLAHLTARAMIQRRVERVHELLLVPRVVRVPRGMSAPRHHQLAVLRQAHLRVAQRLARVALQRVHARVHREERRVLLRLRRRGRLQDGLRHLALVPEQVAVQTHIARRFRLGLLRLQRTLHLGRHHLHVRRVQPQHLVLRQPPEPLEQLQLLHQPRLRLLAQRRARLAQTLRAQQRVRLLVRTRPSPRLRLAVAQLVQRRACRTCRARRAGHALAALRQQVAQVVVLVPPLTQLLQLAPPRRVQLLHRDVRHCQRVQRTLSLLRLLSLHATRAQLLQRAALHAEPAALLARQRRARIHRRALAQPDRLADGRQCRVLFRTDAPRLRRRVLLQRVRQLAARALLVQRVQPRVDRLDAVRVHPRLRVGELARVVAQHHAPVLLPQAPRVGLLHAARHVQLRLHRAARHQRRGRQVVAVLVHRTQVVLLRLLCLRLHRLGLRRLLHVSSTIAASRSTTLVPDHLAILVGDDARGEVVLVVVVHQRVLGGDHQRRVARVAVHVVLREEHARIGEVLLLLTGIVCHHLHAVAVRVLHHAALGGGVLLRHFLAVLREQGVRLVQLVLFQVLQVITRVAVLHRQRMVIIQTRHHCLHIAVLTGRRLL